MENIYKLIFEPVYDFDEISFEISELLGENIDVVYSEAYFKGVFKRCLKEKI
jgi:hypothetical protein